MNSLARVFSNFKEFYNDINAATLTGAIDVIVVEQPDGEFHCSPFHVRFGKLGVLRSREKVVDIEINGAPVDIQMKLGDSGEAFFVEECADSESEELPENLATSPIPKSYFPTDSAIVESAHSIATASDKTKNASDELQIALPLPRRNSIDFSKDAPKEADAIGNKFENQVSDYSKRRHTDNTLERSTLSDRVKEYTTQKIRQEWAEHEEVFQFDSVGKDKDWSNNSTQSERNQKETIAPSSEVDITFESAQSTKPLDIPNNDSNAKEAPPIIVNVPADNQVKDDSKSKTKKRRKKSQMKKKNSQRKASSSSSVGSTVVGDGNGSGGDGLAAPSAVASPINDEPDTQSVAISIATNSSSNEDFTTKSGEQQSVGLITANGGDDSPLSNVTGVTLPHTPSTQCIHDLDIHFFSDTEATTPTSCGAGGASVRGVGRPSTPIQSDSELETTMREKHHDADKNAASWKWGELPTPELTKDSARNLENFKTERNSMLSNMFSFMKKANNIRKQATEASDIYLSDLDTGNLDPEMVALYFPTPLSKETAKSGDEESGNGTSLPHSPSSLEGQKSIDSDYDDGKQQDNIYPECGAMSLCGLNENGETSDEEFDRHIIKFSDVCKNPSLFSSPNLVVRLGDKYYTWTTACPIVMSFVIFQKPLTDEVVKQLITGTTGENHEKAIDVDNKDIHESVDGNPSAPANADPAQTKRSWWNWRRSQGSNVGNADIKIIKAEEKSDEKDGDPTAVATQTSRPETPDVSEKTFSKTDSLMNAENTSALVDNMEDLSMMSNRSDEHKERYKKSLRLSSSAIKKLNLKEGMNEIEFSVTTAYQGTTRCKCYLFRWRHNDKVVISDIDGTITKSDVLGHILPMVGKDWAQLGVAQLFSKIEQNGYKLLYLSARAIGQSRVTREYLRSIRQGNVMLPEGPLLLNPTSLISAFHREVIEKKPEQFKIACLSDIRDLFPNKDPFYAGYGNRINDVWAYRAVGISITRIFTINTKGELKHELTQTFQSSYCSMTYIADQLFPPIKYDETAVEFSNFNYWRDPIPDVDREIEEMMVSSDKPEVNAALAKSLRTIPEKPEIQKKNKGIV